MVETDFRGYKSTLPLIVYVEDVVVLIDIGLLRTIVVGLVVLGGTGIIELVGIAVLEDIYLGFLVRRDCGRGKLVV